MTNVQLNEYFFKYLMYGQLKCLHHKTDIKTTAFCQYKENISRILSNCKYQFDFITLLIFGKLIFFYFIVKYNLIANKL